jgi:hypothetical protein
MRSGGGVQQEGQEVLSVVATPHREDVLTSRTDSQELLLCRESGVSNSVA